MLCLTIVAVLCSQAWLPFTVAKFYQAHNVTGNQFVSFTQVNTGSRILCLELCNKHESCQAVTYSQSTAACNTGTLDAAQTGGAETEVWMTTCKF